MRFYVNSELVATLNNDDALDHCKNCPYCYTVDEEHHICMMLGVEELNLEEELENEDDNQLECWIP